jgi:hypothetical protein
MNVRMAAFAALAATASCAQVPGRRSPQPMAVVADLADLPTLAAEPSVDLPAGTWRAMRSEHFLVWTDTEVARARPLVDRLEDVFEALSTTYFESLPMPRIDVLLFAREQEFRQVAPDGLTGFFIPDIGDRADGWMVLSADGDFEAAAAVAAHELGHRFLYALSDRVPTWLHEGFAKYVGAARVEGDRLTFDAAPIRTDRASPVPLRRLFASSSADFFGASARRQYLTAWMLVRRLLAGQTPDASHWRNLVARTVVAPTPAAQAAIISEALGGLSPDEMDGAIRPERSHDPERTMAVVTLARANRRQPRVAAVDPAAVAALRRAVKERARP